MSSNLEFSNKYMSLPIYLRNKEKVILNSPSQQIFLWSSKYDRFKVFPAIHEIYEQFPNKNIQRDDVVSVLKEDSYKGFIAAMLWGGINASRPHRGGTNTSLDLLMQEPKEKVIESIEYTREEILSGDVVKLFCSFSKGGKYKLGGVDSAYFTKLFYFLGEIEQDNIAIKPLIWDKWTSNAHCALLIDSEQNTHLLPYLGIDERNGQVRLPTGEAKAKLYQKYIEDFNQWANDLGVAAGKLEEYVFGQSLKQNKTIGNPRIDLFAIINQHFNGSDIDASLLNVKTIIESTNSQNSI